MVAIVHSNARVFARASGGQRLLTWAAIAAVATFLLGWGAFTLHRGDLAAARYASQAAYAAACLAFVFYYVSGPLSRLVPSEPTAALGKKTPAIAAAFSAIYAIFLFWVIAPYVVTRTRVPLPTATFCVLSAAVLLVFALGACTGRFAKTAGGRTLMRLCHAYFWFGFMASYFDYVTGPHRTNYIYGPALSLLAIALLLRFADSLVQRRNAAMSERARAP